ncbi:MAG: cytochrome b/b6 domain-containing protein [Pseudomonadales bacterium]|nr:cytochrome b/b6 domain-containing protein [Pseudomonadales bacterium]
MRKIKHAGSNKKNQLVWDLPLRIFHWILALLVGISIYTGLDASLDAMEYHFLSGYGILSLVIFRISWGFIAQGNARFSNFVQGPTAVLAYICNPATRSLSHQGHNPVGALSTLLLLTSLIIQTTSGLFSTDDIMYDGPLTHLVNSDTSHIFATLHHYNYWFLATLCTIHIGAILYYELIKNERLVLPMITGRKRLKPPPTSTTPNQIALATVILICSAACVYYLVNYV